MMPIFLKEVNSFFSSLVGYLAIGVFLVITGLLVWVFPETNVLDYGYADMYAFFNFSPYVLLFLIPAITMRMFAEEKKSGTLETLITRPVSQIQVIMAKYAAALVLVIFAILPTLLYYFSLHQLAFPAGNIDTPGIIGSYIGLILLGSAFVAIGVFTSALTENQIIAFIIAVFLCYFFYSGISSLAAINPWSSSSHFLESLSLVYHYDALGKGLLDLGNIFYLLSISILLIALTDIYLKSRNW